MNTSRMLYLKGVNPNLPQYAVFWAMFAPEIRPTPQLTNKKDI